MAAVYVIIIISFYVYAPDGFFGRRYYFGGKTYVL